MKLEEVILRDTRAAQPAANTVPEGSLYYVTDEAVTERSDGTNWQDYSDGGTPGAMTLLGQGEGTDSSAGATNVFTLAISGLTVKDHLLILLNHSSIVNTTTTPNIRNDTDTLKIQDCCIGLGSIANGIFFIEQINISPDQSSNLAVLSYSAGFKSGTTFQQGIGGSVTFTTAWTGSWTLALRHGGVAAGGTYRYRIAVYKIAGQ